MYLKARQKSSIYSCKAGLACRLEDPWDLGAFNLYPFRRS